jgi:uroporphyrinogen decarboxylase
MMGGVDKHILAGPKVGIEDEVHRLLPLVEEGGYIAFCDHRVPPDVPLDHYMHYLTTARRVWGKDLPNLKPLGNLAAPLPARC